MYTQEAEGVALTSYKPFTLEFVELAGVRLWFAAYPWEGGYDIVQFRLIEGEQSRWWQDQAPHFWAKTIEEAREIVSDINNPLVTRISNGKLTERIVHGEPVGLEEIADRLGAARNTVDSWRRRGVLPDPEPTTVGGRPWWRWDRIEAWAIETHRMP